MLYLTRHIDQTIKIGNDIEIVILQIRGNTVKIGIEAPHEVKIFRSELLTKKKELKPRGTLTPPQRKRQPAHS